jgi:hypothetical protein
MKYYNILTGRYEHRYTNYFAEVNPCSEIKLGPTVMMPTGRELWQAEEIRRLNALAVYNADKLEVLEEKLEGQKHQLQNQYATISHMHSENSQQAESIESQKQTIENYRAEIRWRNEQNNSRW